MADNAVPFELAEACLAHAVGSAVVQAYQRSSMLARRRPIMQGWADFLTDKTAAKADASRWASRELKSCSSPWSVETRVQIAPRKLRLIV